MSNLWVQPDPCRVGLDLCDGSGWVEFFFTHYDGLGQKIPSTRPMYPLMSFIQFMILKMFLRICHKKRKWKKRVNRLLTNKLWIWIKSRVLQEWLYMLCDVISSIIFSCNFIRYYKNQLIKHVIYLVYFCFSILDF